MKPRVLKYKRPRGYYNSQFSSGEDIREFAKRNLDGMSDQEQRMWARTFGNNLHGSHVVTAIAMISQLPSDLRTIAKDAYQLSMREKNRL